LFAFVDSLLKLVARYYAVWYLFLILDPLEFSIVRVLSTSVLLYGFSSELMVPSVLIIDFLVSVIYLYCDADKVVNSI